MMRALASLLLPGHERAFPSGWHHALVAGAIHRDDETAFKCAVAWLRANDIDDAPFRDHRLLLAVVARFGSRLAGEPAYPRLLGLQRMLWTRSRIALHEARPALRALSAAGIDMLLVKGAARLAESEAAMRARAAHDIDIVIRPEQCADALRILTSEGWAANKGFSAHYLRERLAFIRSINMLKGNSGDIDLHTRPFYPDQGTDEDDRDLWSRALPASLSDIAVAIPAPEDRIALAIGLGGLEGHQHSNWLVDSALIIARQQVDWDLLQAIVARRRLTVPAAIALHYLADALQHDIPRDVLDRLRAEARAHPLAYGSGFLHARPHDRASAFGRFLNEAARHLRRRALRRNAPRRQDRKLKARSLGRWRGETLPSPVTEHGFDIPPPAMQNGQLHLRGVVFVDAPARRRRIEFEINAPDRHICRIRYRKLSKRGRPLLLGFEGDIEIAGDEGGLVLQARPSRQTRDSAEPGERERYERLPFHVVSLEVTSPGGGAASRPT
jgi:hypothetical protein